MGSPKTLNQTEGEFMKDQMKKLVLLFVTVVGLSTAAEARTATGPEIIDYADAVIAKLNDTVCGNSQRWNVDVIMKMATSLEVTDGEQPLLVFTVNSSDRISLMGYDRLQVLVTTNATFTDLHDVMIYPYKKSRVNDGTLMNPFIRDGYRLYENRRANCR
jgi:hypothetical protein